MLNKRLEEKVMDIQIGDRITYKCININKEDLEVEIIKDNIMLDDYKNRFENDFWELLKVERPNYSVIEEKKDLLTEEEREFLNIMIKFYVITHIRFNDTDIDFLNNEHTVSYLDYPVNLNFNNVKRHKRCALSELRIGGINKCMEYGTL